LTSPFFDFAEKDVQYHQKGGVVSISGVFEGDSSKKDIVLDKAKCLNGGVGENIFSYQEINFHVPAPVSPCFPPQQEGERQGVFRLEIPFPQKIAQAPFRGIQ
jgi:hypothetical protein